VQEVLERYLVGLGVVDEQSGAALCLNPGNRVFGRLK